jgi:hypothetical protein
LLVTRIFFYITRNLLAYIYIPVVQKEVDFFRKTIWNSHRIRKQNDARLPKGIPDHVFNFPKKYETEECGGMYVAQKLLYSQNGRLSSIAG